MSVPVLAQGLLAGLPPPGGGGDRVSIFFSANLRLGHVRSSSPIRVQERILSPTAYARAHGPWPLTHVVHRKEGEWYGAEAVDLGSGSPLPSSPSWLNRGSETPPPTLDHHH